MELANALARAGKAVGMYIFKYHLVTKLCICLHIFLNSCMLCVSDNPDIQNFNINSKI